MQAIALAVLLYHTTIFPFCQSAVCRAAKVYADFFSASLFSVKADENLDFPVRARYN
jgi:hypothetical protein